MTDILYECLAVTGRGSPSFRLSPFWGHGINDPEILENGKVLSLSSPTSLEHTPIKLEWVLDRTFSGKEGNLPTSSPALISQYCEPRLRRTIFLCIEKVDRRPDTFQVDLGAAPPLEVLPREDL